MRLPDPVFQGTILTGEWGRMEAEALASGQYPRGAALVHITGTGTSPLAFLSPSLLFLDIPSFVVVFLGRFQTIMTWQ